MSDATVSPTTNPTTPFPWWIVAGGLLLSALYLPTLSAPFDFIDDGNLVYPVPEPTLAGQVSVWWDRVVANVEHLGPFRPVLLAHWQLLSNVCDGDPLAWRAARLGWCAVAAMMLLWLLRELKAHPVAALVATAAAMWNPYRNEIWTSLTLAEGVAMPYALLALVAARKAAGSSRPWRWDAAAVFGLLFALGCKNVFVALVPAMAVLRVLSPTGSEAGATRKRLARSAVYLLPLILPAVHFAYFKLNWKPGNYEVAGPSWEQVSRFALWLKGAAGVDFLAVGVAMVLGCVVWKRTETSPPGPQYMNGEGVFKVETPLLRSPTLRVGEVASDSESRATFPTTPNPLRDGEGGSRRLPGEVSPILAALALFFAGFAVYLPMDMMSARYTMPAVWGVDILFALLLTRFLRLPDVRVTRVAWAGVAVGLLAVAVASVGRQEKVAARSRLLWDLVEHVEKAAPFGEPVAWIGGDSTVGELNVEEGIHFYWHLLHRGRGDIRVGLFDAANQPLSRVELAPLERDARTRITAGTPGDSAAWELSRTFTQPYRLGRRRYEARLELTRTPLPRPYTPVMPKELPATGQGFAFDARTAKFMQDAFTNPGGESAALKNLLPQGANAIDLLTGGEK